MDRSIVGVVAAVAGLLAVAGRAGVKEGPAASQSLSPTTGAPVVVELFTSQGCSSCPPADRLLSRLGGDRRWQGRIVPLAYHVDYWNSLGWADPFSSPEWSRRQEEYARASGSRRIYTPQVVVGGSEECVGSEEDEVLARIERAAARPAGRVGIAVRRDPSGLEVDLDLAPPPALGRPLQAMLAVYEDGLVTDVGRGENAGRRATDDFVVRQLRRVAELGPGAAGHATVRLAIDPRWRADRLGIAVFLQDPVSQGIFGAASTALPAP